MNNIVMDHDFKEGYRRPSKTEKEKIFKYLEKNNKPRIRFLFTISITCIFIAALLLFDTILYRNTTSIVFSVIKGISIFVFLGFAYYFLCRGKDKQEPITQINAGDFYINLVKGYEVEGNAIRVHKGADFSKTLFEIDEASIEEWKTNKNMIFKLVRMEYEIRGKKKVYYELFSDSKLK